MTKNGTGNRLRKLARNFYTKRVRRILLRWSVTAKILRNMEMNADAPHWRDKDEEKNLESQPPTGEQLMLHGLWSIEFYTPSQIESLFQGFEKLGWDKETDYNSSPINWVRGQRNTMLGGGWFNLGYIHSIPKTSVFDRDRTAPLPDSVEFATGAVLTLTSSLTCVALFFGYKADRLSSFQNALTKTRTTYLSPSKKGGYSVNGPEDQKRSDIEAIRKRCRAEAWQWYRSNLPGVFSSQAILPREFPTCELLTTVIAEPFPPLSGRTEKAPRYLDALDLNFSYEAWASHTLLSFKLGTHSRKDRFHLVAAVKIDELVAAAEKSHRGKDKSGADAYANVIMEAFMSRWGLVGLFSLLQRRVNLLRDGVRRYASYRNPAVQSLSALTDVELRSLDVITVANDTQHFAENKPWFMHNVSDFRPINSQPYNGESFAENIRSHVAEQAKWLASADEQVRRAVTQQAHLLATRENIRLQQWMAALTVVAVMLALVSIVTATNSGRAHLEPIVSRILSWDPYN